jgi:hypothetical protein
MFYFGKLSKPSKEKEKRKKKETKVQKVQKVQKVCFWEGENGPNSPYYEGKKIVIRHI